MFVAETSVQLPATGLGGLSMKLGLFIGYSGAQMQLPVELVQRAEALGYDSVWTAEAYGRCSLLELGFVPE